MQDNRETGKSSGNFCKDIQAELGIRAGFELVSAVAGSDRDRQRINAGPLNKLFYLIGVCEHSLVGVDADCVLDACQCSQLSLDNGAVLVRILSDALGLRNVVLKIMAGIIDHDRGKSAVDALFANSKVCAVVQMQSDRDLGIQLHSSLNEFLKVNRIRILSCARRSLQDHGGLELSCCLGDRLNDLHVVDIECTYCIAAAISFLKHFSCCY